MPEVFDWRKLQGSEWTLFLSSFHCHPYQDLMFWENMAKFRPWVCSLAILVLWVGGLERKRLKGFSWLQVNTKAVEELWKIVWILGNLNRWQVSTVILICSHRHAIKSQHCQWLSVWLCEHFLPSVGAIFLIYTWGYQCIFLHNGFNDYIKSLNKMYPIKGAYYSVCHIVATQ